MLPPFRQRRWKRLIRGTLLLVAAGLIFDGNGSARAQVSGQVYHSVGPAVFTNAAAWGYADGQLAGTNFVCGVYAGMDANELTPAFNLPDGHLKDAFSSRGYVWLWGSVNATVPPWATILLQFRAWPAEFGTYEEAVASGVPSPPVGVSEVVPALPGGVIMEFPIQTALPWLSPVMPTNAPLPSLTCTLALGSVMLSWPTNAEGFMLVGASSLTANADWSPATGTVLVSNGQTRVSVPMTNASRFFRLRR